MAQSYVRNWDEVVVNGRHVRCLTFPLLRLPTLWHERPMLNILSLIIGFVSLVLAIFAFLPLLGIANWIIVPLALIGLALGQLSDRRSGRNLCLIVVVIGIVRLWLGGGIL